MSWCTGSEGTLWPSATMHSKLSLTVCSDTHQAMLHLLSVIRPCLHCRKVNLCNLSFIHRSLHERYEADLFGAPTIILLNKKHIPEFPASLCGSCRVGHSSCHTGWKGVAGGFVRPGPRLHPPALVPLSTSKLCDLQLPQTVVGEILSRTPSACQIWTLQSGTDGALPGGVGCLRSRACWAVVVAMEPQDKKQVSSASVYAIFMSLGWRGVYWADWAPGI